MQKIFYWFVFVFGLWFTVEGWMAPNQTWDKWAYIIVGGMLLYLWYAKLWDRGVDNS